MAFTITGSGRMAVDPTLTKVSPTFTVCNFRVLSNRWAPKGDVIEAVDCFATDEVAERLTKLVQKGQVIEIMGVQETSTFESSSEPGKKRTAVRYRIVHFVPGPRPKARTEEAPQGDGSSAWDRAD